MPCCKLFAYLRYFLFAHQHGVTWCFTIFIIYEFTVLRFSLEFLRIFVAFYFVKNDLTRMIQMKNLNVVV